MHCQDMCLLQTQVLKAKQILSENLNKTSVAVDILVIMKILLNWDIKSFQEQMDHFNNQMIINSFKFLQAKTLITYLDLIRHLQIAFMD
ncbi:unnamed protein product [Paramecium primaurelia]|uniref:Uncharacterized protein n=1 Tax=Paramecium primaurelia TaxID=5886 RepID=A0A8S1PQN1_PARPR|nr:unnamed protein product [Paramecium primaurelia]